MCLAQPIVRRWLLTFPSPLAASTLALKELPNPERQRPQKGINPRSACSLGRMSLMSEPHDRLEETTDKLLATAERCYRLAGGITDRQAIVALWQLAEECEKRAAAIRRGAG